ncbi:MAG: hypothetical protein AAF491_07235 [Verrucomicrobiota bacterium]
MGSSESRSFWLNEAVRVRRRINLGWWLERLNWILLLLFLLLSAFILWDRTEEKGVLDLPRLAWTSLLLALVASAVAWLGSRKRFVDLKEALVRLDDRWSLDNRLVSAHAEQASWPPREAARSSGAMPMWRVTTALIPSLIALCAAGLTWIVPLPERQAKAPEISTEPRAWEEMDDWVETLEAEEWIEPESLEEIAEQVNELRDQPEEEWFSHSSLEATDNLQEAFGRDLQDLARDMAAMERSLEALRTFSTDLSAEGREMLIREFSEALESLGSNGVSLNEELARQLEGLDPSQLGEATLGGLSAEQLEQLRQQLGEGAETLGALEGLGPMSGGEEFGFGEGTGLIPGKGGVQRGPGDAPLFFGEEDDLGTNRIEAVSNEDLSRARVGDLLGLGETEYGDDLPSVGIQEGGAVRSSGSGGDAVWKDTLSPEEQAVLKRYFD